MLVSQDSAPMEQQAHPYEYQEGWDARALSSMMEAQLVSTMSEDGGAGSEHVNELTTAARSMNFGQRLPGCMRKYEGRQFTGSFSHVQCLFDSGNTMSPGIAISLALAQRLKLEITPYNVEVKNVNGGTCPIVGVVAPGKLTISFNTSNQASNEFEVWPLILREMQDEVNMGIAFMRKLKMQVHFNNPVEIWAPLLGTLIDPLAPLPSHQSADRRTG